MKRVAIIGGGIVGMSTAWYLNRSGHHVTIIDKDDMQGGTSWGNAGMIVPSHFIPLAAPGMISKGIRWMFNSLSPFYVRARLDADFIRWGWKFYRSATHKKVDEAAPALRDLSLYSKDCYQELASDIPFGLHSRGLLMLYRRHETGEEELETVDMATRLGIEARALSLKEVRQLEPGVEIDALGGIFFPGDMHLTPSELMTTLRGKLLDAGVQLLGSRNVHDFEIIGRRVSKAITTEGAIDFDEIVLAAGAWSPQLAHKLGLTIPVEAGKGYSFMVSSGEQKVQIPTLLLDDRVAVTPMGADIRFGGTMEIGGIDHSINMKRVQGIVDSIPRYYPRMRVSMPSQADVWHGLRPCSPDGLPFIGRSKQYENLLIATGHGMMGVSLGPGTGRAVADIINGIAPGVSLDAFDADRFG
jgi:D-amino-acid dehydrogenase